MNDVALRRSMKKENDVKLLQAIIAQQNSQGAKMPTDLDALRYEWEDGRLTRLYLAFCNLSGSRNLSGLESLNISKNPVMEDQACHGSR